jgi:competence ComEA-like helix-hairpin-helix protein
MPTPSEQKALAFVAIVVVLGGAVRVVRAGSAAQPTVMEQQALARQATAAESAASVSRPKKGQRGRSPKPKRDAGDHVVGGLAGAPPRFDRTGLLTTETGVNGFPPPSPRIDTDVRRGGGWSRGPGQPVGPNRQPQSTAPRVDLDRASIDDIDHLPRVGPALARRIVASRDSFGAFGSLEGLKRVKGIGAATLEQLAPLVTFSGRASSRP